MRHTNIHTSCRGAPAFTLVELLMVITIVIVLASILLPTVDAARIAAKNTATAALLHSVGAGLDMFKSESRLGRVYPPSIWRTDGSGDTPDPGGDPYGLSNYTAYGAQTLVWGLAGADLLGTPGFLVDSTTPLSNINGGLYYLSGGAPAKPRFGPFIDVSRTKIKRPGADLGITISSPGNSNPPVTVDDFNRPVLYFAPHSNPFGNPPGAIEYQFADNIGFHDAAGPDAANFWTSSGFRSYIEDTRVSQLTTVYGAYNPDSYLLITAGPDKRYGTRDDICNFPFNALE